MHCLFLNAFTYTEVFGLESSALSHNRDSSSMALELQGPRMVRSIDAFFKSTEEAHNTLLIQNHSKRGFRHLQRGTKVRSQQVV